MGKPGEPCGLPEGRGRAESLGRLWWLEFSGEESCTERTPDSCRDPRVFPSAQMGGKKSPERIRPKLTPAGEQGSLPTARLEKSHNPWALGRML